MTAFAILLFWLIVAHAICDYPLQGPFMAAAKRAHLLEGAGGYWLFALTYHAMIHAAAVAIITGSYSLAALEFITHWLTDRAKTTGWIGVKVDQSIHLAFKVIWAAVAIGKPWS